MRERVELAAQEALANVRKHAGARNVEVLLEPRDGGLRVELHGGAGSRGALDPPPSAGMTTVRAGSDAGRLPFVIGRPLPRLKTALAPVPPLVVAQASLGACTRAPAGAHQLVPDAPPREVEGLLLVHLARGMIPWRVPLDVGCFASPDKVYPPAEIASGRARGEARRAETRRRA